MGIDVEKTHGHLLRHIPDTTPEQRTLAAQLIRRLNDDPDLYLTMLDLG